MNFIVPKPKIVDYLLTNPAKSGFFLQFGYSIQGWTRLRDDILSLARNFPLNFKVATAYGKKYVIHGNVQTPNGRVITLTTIWMAYIEYPQEMNFLTAYPA